MSALPSLPNYVVRDRIADAIRHYRENSYVEASLLVLGYMTLGELQHELISDTVSLNKEALLRAMQNGHFTHMNGLELLIDYHHADRISVFGF